MADFCNELAVDIAKDCANPATAQLEQKVLLIPSSALPASGITITDNLITGISTSSGTQGYLIEGLQQKTWTNHNNTFLNPQDGTAGFTHTIENIHIMNPSVETRHAIDDLASGGSTYFAIVERKWKGIDSEDAFLFFGLKFGLCIPDGGIIDNSGENDGKIVITLQTPAGFKEPFLPAVFLDTDYDTTATAVWTNQLATA